jgi:CPA2 family monovalent cation:H+ antiporter-2
MEELGLVDDLAAVTIAALIGGTVARLLRLPTIVGYLAAGIALGPETPGPTGDITEVGTIADLGVALLMFTIGIEFSLRELNKFRSLAVVGGLGVIAVMVAVTTGVGTATGLTTEEAIVVGMAASLSSSMLALRLLENRGLLGAPAGRVTIVIALVQDLSVVIMATVLPVMGGSTDALAGDLALAALKAVALLAGVWAVGTFFLPVVLARMAASRSRDLFLVMIVAMALGTATLSAEAGLSLAFGAFLAGIVLSESEYSHRTLVEVFPLREVFAVVFFVAIGMLFDPDAFADNPELVLGLIFVSVAVKGGLIGVVAAAFRYPLRVAFPAALALGSMGEFSFVISSQAVDEGVIGEEVDKAILAAMLVSMMIAALLFGVQANLLRGARAVPVIGGVLRPRTDIHVPEEAPLVNHAILVGYNQAGRQVAASLAMRNFRYVVIDEDPEVFRELSAAGVPCVLGNAATPTLLTQAGVERARVLVVTVTEPGLVESVTATARQLNHRLAVIARGYGPAEIERLHLLGASRVVESEFEVGTQFVRHTLQRFGMTSQEVQAFLSRMRDDRLGEQGERR